MLACSKSKCTAKKSLLLITQWTNADFNRFPFNGFTYCFTFFPKRFSSFPHGTCSLSVSRHYLALDEIYHPLWAAFPNNPTLRLLIVEDRNQATNRIVTFHDGVFLTTLRPDAHQKNNLETTIRCGNHRDLKFELFPLHSPLLRES